MKPTLKDWAGDAGALIGIAIFILTLCVLAPAMSDVLLSAMSQPTQTAEIQP